MNKKEKHNVASRKWKAANPEYDKNYRLANPEKVKRLDHLRKNRYRKKYPEKVRETHLKKYGLTPEKFNEILVSQNGVCAICLQSETIKQNKKVKRLSIDHNHKTGQVRQLLCNNCNSAIGYLQDSPLLAQNLTNYLIKWN